MNIFYLDHCPKQAARMLCDKHIPKMLLETAQLLCTLVPQERSPYKHTHRNHPCAVWLRESFENVYWLVEYAYWLHEEFKCRFGKEHKSYAVIEQIWSESHRSYDTKFNVPMTPVKQCMPERYHDVDPVKAYRYYYFNEKRFFCRWDKGRGMPQFMEDLYCEMYEIS